jgi:hypothetical protein
MRTGWLAAGSIYHSSAVFLDVATVTYSILSSLMLDMQAPSSQALIAQPNTLYFAQFLFRSAILLRRLIRRKHELE